MRTTGETQSATQVLERVSDAYYEIDSEWRIRYWNGGMESRTGVAREDALGRNLWERFPEVEGTEFERNYRTAMETGEAVSFQSVLRSAGYEVVVDVYPTDDGLAVYSREVTEGLEHERRLDAVFDNTDQHMALLRTDGLVVEANDAFVRFVGVPRDRVVGRRIAGLFRSTFDNTEVTRTAVDRGNDLFERAADGECVREELAIRDSVVDLSLNPVTGADGDVLYIVVEGRETTAEKRREEELERQHDLFRRVQEMAGIGAWMLDFETEELTWTEEVYRIHEVDPEEFTPDLDAGIRFYHPEDRPVLERAIERGLATGEGWNLELRLITAKDNTVWVRAKGDVVTEDSGTTTVRGTVQDITEQHEYQQRLRDSREQLRAIIDALPQYIWLKNGAGEYVLANEAIAAGYGTTSEELEGSTDAEYAVSDPDRDFRADDRAVVERGERREFVESITDANGDDHIVQVELRPIDSVVTGERLLLGITTDITDRERITRNLRESAAYLQQLYEVSTSSKPLDRKLRELLAAGCERFGLELGLVARIDDGTYAVRSAHDETGSVAAGARFDVSETYCEMTVATEDVVCFASATVDIERAHPAYETFGLESYIGAPLYVDDELYGTVNFSSADPRREAFAPSERVYVKLLSEWIGYELEQQRREEEAERRRRQLGQIIDVVPLPIFVKDADGDYLLANEATAEVFGLRADELVGRSDEEFLPDAVAARIRADEAEVLRSGEPLRRLTEELPAPDGSTRTYQTRRVPFDADDEDAVLGVAVDITELKRSERRLTQAYEELTRNKEELEVRYSQLEFFDSLLRHDVLNSLTVIRCTAELLLDDVDGSLREDVRTILEWSDDIVLLVRRVRHVIEVLTGGATGTDVVDAVACIDAEVGRLSAAHPDATIRVDAPESVLVEADDLFSEVVGNVVANAVDHADGPTPAVDVTVELAGERVRITVADDGPGIPVDRREAVFRRGETTHVKKSGGGFGLFFVDSMVSAYGGEVTVADNDPRGVRFVIELPRYH